MLYGLFRSSIVLTNMSDRNVSDDEDAVVATRPKQSEGLLAKMILIRVGGALDLQTTPVHRKFLCKMSHYFRNAFKDDPEKSSFEFLEQEPEIFERVMNWIYGQGFLLPKDDAMSDDADWFSTQASEDVHQDTNGPVDHIIVEHGSGFRQSVAPVPTTKFIDTTTNLDFSDHEQDSQALENITHKADAPTPLDSMMLSKIYALAEFLQMDKLCNELIELLGQRLGYDKKTPGQALIYAFQRCSADSPLRKLLIDFTARSAPIFHVLDDPTFDATPELWRALVRELATVRGADVLNADQWVEHFEATLGDYCL
jgi:hypothetical protein